jgi:hypothetical protein
MVITFSLNMIAKKTGSSKSVARKGTPQGPNIDDFERMIDSVLFTPEKVVINSYFIPFQERPPSKASSRKESN